MENFQKKMLNVQVPLSTDVTSSNDYYQQQQQQSNEDTNNPSRSSSVLSSQSSSSSSAAYSPASSVCSSQTDSPNKPSNAYHCYSTPNISTKPQLQQQYPLTINNIKQQYYDAYSPSQQRLLAMQYQMSHPYNQYYNFNQQNAKPVSCSSSFEDSNYYSRNSSNYDISLNESQQSKNTNSFVYNSLSTTKANAVKASCLKFSIDSILGTKSSSEPMHVHNENDISNEEATSKVVSKKRKSRSSNSKTNISTNETNKRIRTIFTQEQLDKLEIEFNRQQYMVGSERSYLANSLNLSESQVKIWFQNRRIKWRKTSVSNSGAAKFGTDEDFNDEQSYSNDSEYDE